MQAIYFSSTVQVLIRRDEWEARSEHERRFLLRMSMAQDLRGRACLVFTNEDWAKVKPFFPELANQRPPVDKISAS